MAKLCPSAQPGMDQCRVLGVVQRDGPAPMLQYLNEHCRRRRKFSPWPRP